MSLSNNNILGHIEGCKQNNRDSQQQLYGLLYGYAYTISFRYSKDEQEANALANDSFLKLFKNIHTCKLDKSGNMVNSFKGWFKRIIVNTCIDRYRSLHDVKQYDIDTQYTLAEKSENGEDIMGYKEIIGAVMQLSPAYRTVFNLHVMEGLTHEEIGGLLGISAGTSKSNLSKAREHLRAIIQKKMNYNNTYVASVR